VKTYHLGGYLGGMAGAFALRGGGMWAWSDIDTSRAVVFPDFYERQKAGYHADTGQLFGEAAADIRCVVPPLLSEDTLESLIRRRL